MLTLPQTKTKAGSLHPEFLRTLSERWQLTAMVESGPLDGNNAAADAIFPVVHKIDFSEGLGAKAIAQLTGPTLFRLHGQGSSGVAAFAGQNVTVGEECETVARNAPEGSVILVDDLRLFDGSVNRPNLPTSMRGCPALTEIYGMFAEMGYQFFVLGDVGLAVSAKAEFAVSPLIQALTISRLYDGENLDVHEVFAAEAVVMQAQGEEREALRAMGEMPSATTSSAVGLYNRFWFALSLLGEGRLAAAGERLVSVACDGFNHWRLRWYFAQAFHGTGEVEMARALLRELIERAPNFAPAIAMLGETGRQSTPSTVARAPSATPGAAPVPRLELAKFFPVDECYAILRLSEDFPAYRDYSDVDVLCKDAVSMLRRILAVGAEYEKHGYTIKVSALGRQLHVDFYPPQARRLSLRFDLFDTLEGYNKFSIAPGYAADILAHRRRVTRGGVDVFVPSREDDLALRFLEYVQHVADRPDKIKHLEYIRRAGDLGFLDRVHAYTDLEVRVQNPTGAAEFAVSRKKRAKGTIPQARIREEYYRLSPTCQVPGLSGYYEALFGRRTNGTFIEVGAFDGDYVSNTSGLADLGWAGHYIEPVPQYAEKCRNRHARNPNVSVCNAAVGKEPKRVRLHIGGPLTTASDTMKDLFENLDWAKGTFRSGETVEVDQITLEQYLKARRVEPGFELLVIDVEGGEWGVLQGFDIRRWKPQVVIIELHDQNQDYKAIRNECAQIVRYFDEHAYIPVFKDKTNTVYVAREKLMAARERMDAFLLWGHGLQHAEAALEMIRRRADLEILAIHRRAVTDMAKFVRELYACDTVPFEHLREKTRYLLTTPKEVLLILVRNHNPQERFYGEGAFRHIQCSLVKDVKEEARNAWNPRANGKRTEDHVIHATDYETQVVHTMKVLGLPAPETYLRQSSRDYDVPYHLGAAKECREVEVGLDRIRGRILGQGIVPIEQTPHYRFVAGDRASYLQYLERHFGRDLTDDHSAGAFDRLIAEFDYGRLGRNGKPGLLVVAPHEGNYLLLDGVHRAAILKHRGVSTVRVLEVQSHASQAKSSLPVVVKLMGGLGNQMFQYAAGLALARKHGVPLKLDLTFLRDRTPRAHFTPRDYALGIFPLGSDCELITDAGAIPSGIRRVAEKRFHHDPAVDELPAGVHLEGYWQSPRYFENVQAEIRNHFTLTPALDETAAALAGRIDAAEAVCLHVRRGDMVHDAHIASVHGSCSPEYYRSACDLIARSFPAAHYFIFSDDPRWCESQNLTRGRANTIVSREGASEAVDLFLMRRCKHFVIANSSFAWWAAFLGRGAESIVIAPAPWFSDLSVETADLLPAEWMQLSRNPGPSLADLGAAPAVSVVVPCYKQAHYLPGAVASVVAQTFPDWELVIVNDGSPDNTSAVARELIAAHPERRITLVDQANGGLANARNAGIRAAKGKYILPLDSDDKLAPEFLAKTVGFLESHSDAKIVTTARKDFGASSRVYPAMRYTLKEIVRHNRINYCTLYRREVWEAVSGYNPNMVWGYEDWDFWVGCAERGWLAEALPEVLFHYRVKSASMFVDAMKHDRELRAQVILNHPRLFDAQTQAQARAIVAASSTKQPNAQLPDVVAVGTAASNAATFEQVVQEGERHVREGRVAEARAQMERARELAPNQECRARVDEILQLLGDVASPEEEKTPPPSADFFGAEECAAIEQLLTAYADNPSNPEVLAQTDALRQGLIEFLWRSDADHVERLLEGDFGKVYRWVMKSGLHRQRLGADHDKLVNALASEVAHAAQPEPARLLALMLLDPGHAALAGQAGNLPTAVRDDYQKGSSRPVLLATG